MGARDEERTERAAVAGAAARPRALLAAVVIGAVEAVGLVAYAIAIAISAWRVGEDGAAAPVQVVIYVLFALGITLVVRGLLSGRRLARGPYVVTQLFGLIVGWTLAAGDGTWVHLTGWIVLALSIAGIALMLNPAVSAALVD